MLELLLNTFGLYMGSRLLSKTYKSDIRPDKFDKRRKLGDKRKRENKFLRKELVKVQNVVEYCHEQDVISDTILIETC